MKDHIRSSLSAPTHWKLHESLKLSNSVSSPLLSFSSRSFVLQTQLSSSSRSLAHTPTLSDIHQAALKGTLSEFKEWHFHSHSSEQQGGTFIHKQQAKAATTTVMMISSINTIYSREEFLRSIGERFGCGARAELSFSLFHMSHVIIL